MQQVEGSLFTSNCGPAYRALKQLRSRPLQEVEAVRNVDGQLVTDRGELKACWASYFENLLKANPPAAALPCPTTVYPDPIPPISEAGPSLKETRDAIAKLKGGKAAGVCGISAELLIAGGDAVAAGLHAVICAVWTFRVIPLDWRKGIIVPIWKGKGDRQDCTNYRGITLLSVPGKVLAHILLSRIRPHLLQTQRPAQSGFTPKKSTVDRILALRILVERRLEFRQRVFAAYVDLKKAFDSVHREALWRIMEHRGIPAGIVALLASLYSGTVSAVRVAGGISEFFPVNSGVRQGCVLAPTLFNACMDWVLGRTVKRSNCGASVGDVKISDLDFADDAVIPDELLDILESSLVILKEETVLCSLVWKFLGRRLGFRPSVT